MAGWTCACDAAVCPLSRCVGAVCGVMVLYVLFPEHQRGDGEQALLLGVATSGPTWCLSEFRQCGRNNVFGNSLYKSQNSVGSSRSG